MAMIDDLLSENGCNAEDEQGGEMDWDDARFFLAVAREGQILRAARRMGTSQARINRRISNFEEAIGEKLFDRRTTGCTLTPAGQDLMPSALAVEEAFLQMRGAAGKGSADKEAMINGTIRIGTPDGFGVTFLAPLIPKLRQLYPGLRVQLVSAPRAFSLSQREADIAIAIGRPLKGRLKASKLTDYSLGLYAADDYVQARGRPQSLTDLADHDLVGYVDDLIYTRELDFNSEIWPDWHSDIEISSALAQVTAIQAGAGIGVLHDFIASKETGLTALFPETKLQRSYWIVWHESMDSIPHVAATTRFIIDEVRAQRGYFME